MAVGFDFCASANAFFISLNSAIAFFISSNSDDEMTPRIVWPSPFFGCLFSTADGGDVDPVLVEMLADGDEITGFVAIGGDVDDGSLLGAPQERGGDAPFPAPLSSPFA